jgi:hypothetical protein
VAGGGAVPATAAATVTSADGATGGSALESGTAGGDAAGSVEAGACVVVDACGSVNRGPLEAREARRDVACSRSAWRTSVPNTSVATSTVTKAAR